MTHLLALAALAAALATPATPAASAAPAATPAPAALDLRPAPAHPADTHCDRCHTPEGWSDVAFAHERTGFPLRGAHARLACRSCHEASFTRALGRTCGSCHRDPHQGQLGARCTGCHQESSWRTTFDADAHRRGNFPLTGRHAFLACEECHGDRRDQGFARATPGCLACHQADWNRTAGTPLDHQAAGFSPQCQRCHLPWRWRGATLAGHDACFRISGGPHAGLACTQCHKPLTTLTVGQCTSGTADCIQCHACGSHPQTAGFACSNRKCYECHQFQGGSSALRAAPTRRGR